MAYWYGWTNDYIDSLLAVDFFDYLLATDLLESREMLRGYGAADWPNRKPADRQKLYRQVYNNAYPRHLRPAKKMTDKDIRQMMKRPTKDE